MTIAELSSLSRSPAFFAASLVLVMALSAIDTKSLPGALDRAMAAFAWLAVIPLVYLKARVSGLDWGQVFAGGGVIYFTVCIASLGRPAVVMDQLMTRDMARKTRVRRTVALCGVAVAAVVMVVPDLLA